MDARLQRRVQRYGWDKAAVHYERTWQRHLEPAQAAMLGMAGPTPGESVLDVACGTGLVSLRAAALVAPGGSVRGTDVSNRSKPGGVAMVTPCRVGSSWSWERNRGNAMSSLAARESLERARRLFLEKPAIARRTNTAATAVWRSGLSCKISGPAAERAITDMPEPMGGKGEGSNPGWLLRAAIASCAATAIAMRAAMTGIALDALEVRVESESDASGLVGIPDVPTALDGLRMSVRIGADGVGEEQLRELVAWANENSPVNCTLRAHPEIALEVVVA